MATNMSQMVAKFNAEHDGHIEIIPPDELVQEMRDNAIVVGEFAWSDEVNFSIREMYVGHPSPQRRKLPRANRLPRGQREYL